VCRDPQSHEGKTLAGACLIEMQKEMDYSNSESECESKALRYTTTHTEPLQLIENSFLILFT
jgi:hypothetical protein